MWPQSFLLEQGGLALAGAEGDPVAAAAVGPVPEHRGLCITSKYLSPEGMVTFKKTKKKVKKIHKKEVMVRTNDLLLLEYQTQDGDFNSRSQGGEGDKLSA